MKNKKRQRTAANSIAHTSEEVLQSGQRYQLLATANSLQKNSAEHEDAGAYINKNRDPDQVAKSQRCYLTLPLTSQRGNAGISKKFKIETKDDTHDGKAHEQVNLPTLAEGMTTKS